MTAAERVAAAVVAVCRSALEARGARRIALVDDGSPEAALVARWVTAGIGPAAMVRVAGREPEMESLLHAAGQPEGDAEVEVLRMRARLVPDAVTAHPANKTALLLGGPLPPERILPLGDLWASEVLELCGAWSSPIAVAELAQRAGGVHALDGVMRAWLEGRDPGALDALPAALAAEVRARFAAGRADRVHPLLVPKLTGRTLGLDLFE